jgi:hypothetical protein
VEDIDHRAFAEAERLANSRGRVLMFGPQQAGSGSAAQPGHLLGEAADMEAHPRLGHEGATRRLAVDHPLAFQQRQSLACRHPADAVLFGKLAF